MAGRNPIAAILVILAIVLPVRASSTTREYQLKAEFLERFTRFIEWPGPPPQTPFRLCTFGGDPFEGYLEQMARQRQLKGRTVEVRHTTSVAELENCDLIFIAVGGQPELAAIVRVTSGKPVLTVADVEGAAREGALISFYEESGKVRFEINVASARRSGLDFSSQLLRLARIVEGSP